jgi:lipoprotein-anchoring transpeptidase ErfK/SrfK
VDQALEASDSLGLFSRVWHRLRHEPLNVTVDLTYRDGGNAVDRLVSTIGRAVARSPRDASLDVVDGKVSIVHARTGSELGTTGAARRIVRALDQGTLTVRLPVEMLKPKVPDAKIGVTIIVDTTLNKLSLYRGFKLLHTYPVATAMPGYVTPPGHWKIINKEMNPTWYNPALTTWGAGMPAVIPPGVGNPMGTRALFLNAPGIRIHGTYETSSIGTHASHGCIRMLIADSEQLYPLVPIGSNVIIF